MISPKSLHISNCKEKPLIGFVHCDFQFFLILHALLFLIEELELRCILYLPPGPAAWLRLFLAMTKRAGALKRTNVMLQKDRKDSLRNVSKKEATLIRRKDQGLQNQSAVPTALKP